MTSNMDVYFTRFYTSMANPGIPRGDRSKRKLVEACEAVDRDIEACGAVTYETVELVRAALALSRIA